MMKRHSTSIVHGRRALIAASLALAASFITPSVGFAHDAEAIQALQDQVAALEELLANVSIEYGPINGLAGPHILIEGANVHVRSGSGATNDAGTLTGLGNLVVGYNESQISWVNRTGSHNLVVGPKHEYSSYGGFIAGENNTTRAPYSSVSGGYNNLADSSSSSVSGGSNNRAEGVSSSVSGGQSNLASAPYSSVSGGISNTASGYRSSVVGGYRNTASGYASSVVGGYGNTASASYSVKP